MKENNKEQVIKEWLPAFVSAIVAFAFQIIADAFTEGISMWQKICYVLIVAVAYFLCVFTILLITTFKKATTKGESIYNEATNDINLAISALETKLNNNVNNLGCQINDLIKANDLLQYIYDGDRVIALEESVGNTMHQHDDLEIYIQSSSFILEKGELSEPILWNLRKGVKYIYMVPVSKISAYIKIVRRWYYDFSKFLISKEKLEEFEEHYSKPELIKYRSFWCDEYMQIVTDARKYWVNNDMDIDINCLRKRCQSLFKRKLITHVEDNSLFFVTIALYEVSENKWEAILKLPTENPAKKYYAFKVPDCAEKTNFVDQFRAYYRSDSYVAGDISTYGGIYDLDFDNQIFES